MLVLEIFHPYRQKGSSPIRSKQITPSRLNEICQIIFIILFFSVLLTCSVFGWDHVTQGLVQLGFFLMDAFGPKPGPFGKTTEGSVTVARTPTQQACKLGRHVLLQGFKVCYICGRSSHNVNN